MRCVRVQALCSAYVDGALSPVLWQKVGRHIRECSGCLQVIKAESTIRDQLAGLGSIEPPAALYGAIVRELSLPSKTSKTQWWFAGGISGVLAAAAIVLVFMWSDNNAVPWPAPDTDSVAADHGLNGTPDRRLVIKTGLDQPNCELLETHAETLACERSLIDDSYASALSELGEMIGGDETARRVFLREPNEGSDSDMGFSPLGHEPMRRLQWAQISSLQRTLLAQEVRP